MKTPIKAVEIAAALYLLISWTKLQTQHGTTFYAITDERGGFLWTKTLPTPPLICDPNSAAYCTIITKDGYTPLPNEVPDSTQAILSAHGIYK